MPHRDSGEVRRRVQREAAAASDMGAINNAFINPLLVSRGAGAFALGAYSSGASLLGFGAGFLGPRLAARVGNVNRAMLLVLTVARCVLLALAMVLAATGDGAVGLLVVVAPAWIACEGLALPLWMAFLTGLASPSERGRWLAPRPWSCSSSSSCRVSCRRNAPCRSPTPSRPWPAGRRGSSWPGSCSSGSAPGWWGR
ncbi:MAG: hypothetical protein ACRDJW_08140 [Thermomicrobiales bacterium]